MIQTGLSPVKILVCLNAERAELEVDR